ncbi:MAG: phosphatase PAP2 family protein [Flavisolibacter sp.]
MTTTSDSIQKKAKGFSWRLLAAVILFLAALLVFIFIADEMVLENENNLDKIAFQHLASITSSGMTKWMIFITFFGSSYFLLPAYILVVVYFLFKKNRSLSLNVAAIALTSAIILFSLKAIFHRHRPPDPLVHNINGFSFPSGHSFSSFTFFGLLIYIIWHLRLPTIWRWTLTLLFFLFASAIAFSRVYLHVHYASDVIAGLCLCIVWLGTSFWVMEKFSKKEAPG